MPTTTPPIDASTGWNLAVDYCERLILEHEHDFVYPETKPLSDRLCGRAN